MAEEANLWQKTPLIYSHPISTRVGPTYLKLETFHPSHSFKYRGISHFARHARRQHGQNVHLIIASGGNAGIAAACAARVLQVKCTVFLPEWAEEQVVSFLQSHKAEVVIVGKVYDEARSAAELAVQTDSDAVMVPAYDSPIVWEGHASMIHEISEQLGIKPAAIVCSVGGGGLLGGLIKGCQDVGWDDVPLVAMGTEGSNCFHHSIQLNHRPSSGHFARPPHSQVVHDPVWDPDVKLVRFGKFNSRASGSLGASQPASRVVGMTLRRPGDVVCVTVPDELSMQAATAFADDHKLLVELACSTTLVPAYKKDLFEKIIPVQPTMDRPVVFIVCGGYKVSLEQMGEFRGLVELDLERNASIGWEVVYGDGERVRVFK